MNVLFLSPLKRRQTYLYCSIMICAVFCVLGAPFDTCVFAQSNPDFNVSLNVDFTSAEQMLDYFDWQTSNIHRLAELKGNVIAAATSVLLARTTRAENDFEHQLESVRNGSLVDKDIYGLLPMKRYVDKLHKLLSEIKHRQLDRRVIATLAAYFPSDTKLFSTIQVYIVTFGNDRAAAVVRRIKWNGNVPIFIDDDTGDPVILVNLVRIVEMVPDVQNQFIELLATLAHESFHATYSLLQQTLPDSCKPQTPIEYLFDIVQNEGIAYYLSLEIHQLGRSLPTKWFDETSKAIEELNKAAVELESNNLTPARARELLMNANLSGSFRGNYGATSGLRMAYEIDTRIGRQALSGTLVRGFRSFLRTYIQVSKQDATLPQLNKHMYDALRLE